MARAGRAGADLVAQDPAFEPLAQGSPADAYPVNDQASDTFQVGGVERSLPDALQLEQLVSYIEATYDRDAEQYLALLPDRITHAAMLMLGSGIDQTMPGVAFPGDVRVEESEFGQVFVPSSAAGSASGSASGGVWAVSVWDGPRSARDNAWRPEVAGAAELADVRILDLDDPARLGEAIDFVRALGADKVAVWAYSSGAAALASASGVSAGGGGAAGGAPRGADAYVLTFPTALPPTGGAPVLLQVATQDEVAPFLPEELMMLSEATTITVQRYHSTHHIATPAESRRRIRDVADFLRAL
ncbi:alpha/beta hydrolase [Corynebacterium sp. TA-R-1]|uniref:Alpha/beta hydrolase n=1 Tax=Corynebacterium stercoris TaxID=2943490 RepID=A0ABT1G286_9CORY|nr:alpha/beta hydrolase [Corynebacterium stercoris]